MAVSPSHSLLTCHADSVDLALREARQAAPDGALIAAIAEGVLLLNVPFAQLAEAWRAKPPIFARHLCPATTTLPLPSLDDAETLLILLQNACREALLPHLAPYVPFSVQTRVFDAAVPLKPFAVNTALAELVSTAPLEVRQPQQVISVALGRLNGQPTAWLGLSAVADNLSSWAGGARRFKHEQGRISRSEFKLLEALEVFRLSTPARGDALDLGAAPGGWTHVLRERGMSVTAVDPAALDPRLLSDPAVRYERMTAEAFLPTARESYDLIVNDMRLDARDSARLTVAYRRLLKAEGWALITLKLPHSERLRALESALESLERAYAIAGARQLFHNRSEVTVHLRPR